MRPCSSGGELWKGPGSRRIEIGLDAQLRCAAAARYRCGLLFFLPATATACFFLPGDDFEPHPMP